MQKSLFAGYALFIAVIYTFVLKGPMLLGWQPFAIKIVLGGLGGFGGTSLINWIIEKENKGSKPFKQRVWQSCGVFAVVSAVLFVAHIMYFDGTQVEYEQFDFVIFLISLVVLAVAFRAFLTAANNASKLLKD